MESKKPEVSVKKNAALIQKYNQGGTAHHNNVMTQLDRIKKHHPN
jgi:hypothetical protein